MTAGSANTNSFVLAQATLMLSTQANVLTLNPSQHSAGLVKNLTVTMTPTYTDLTQGVRGARVASELTNSVTKVSAEIFEYTSANMAYALGLLGSAYTSPALTYLTVGPIVGNTNGAGAAATTTFSNTTDVSGTFLAGQWISIQDPVLTDHVQYAVLASNATVSGTGPYIITLVFTGYGCVTGNNFPAGSIISVVNAIPIGQRVDALYLSAKLTAPLSNGDAISILLPKVRIVKGFNLSFGVEKFDDMPFELDPYDLLPGDPMYANFPNGGCAMLLTNT